MNIAGTIRMTTPAQPGPRRSVGAAAWEAAIGWIAVIASGSGLWSLAFALAG
jgi:hypothetical protein